MTLVLQIQESSRFFRALGDETRLKIVALLCRGELCVCHLEEALHISQPMASRHLNVLRHAGVVQARRDGTWVYYQLAPQSDEHRKVHLELLVKKFKAKKDLAKEIDRITKKVGPKCR